MNDNPANQSEEIKNLVFIFFLVMPAMNAQKIFALWLTHPVLKEYERPDEQWLAAWVEEFVLEKNSYAYKGEYIKV